MAAEPKTKIKKLKLDEMCAQALMRILRMDAVPRAVVDEWAQFKVYCDRLGGGTQVLPTYILVGICQRAGFTPYIPVKVEVDASVVEAMSKPSLGLVQPQEVVADPVVETPKKKGGRPKGSKNKKSRNSRKGIKYGPRKPKILVPVEVAHG